MHGVCFHACIFLYNLVLGRFSHSRARTHSPSTHGHSYRPLLPTQINDLASETQTQTLVLCVLLRLPWSGYVTHPSLLTPWESSDIYITINLGLPSMSGVVSCLDKRPYSMRTRENVHVAVYQTIFGYNTSYTSIPGEQSIQFGCTLTAWTSCCLQRPSSILSYDSSPGVQDSWTRKGTNV